jgi:hypothetical protein
MQHSRSQVDALLEAEVAIITFFPRTARFNAIIYPPDLKNF